MVSSVATYNMRTKHFIECKQCKCVCLCAFPFVDAFHLTCTMHMFARFISTSSSFTIHLILILFSTVFCFSSRFFSSSSSAFRFPHCMAKHSAASSCQLTANCWNALVVIRSCDLWWVLFMKCTIMTIVLLFIKFLLDYFFLSCISNGCAQMYFKCVRHCCLRSSTDLLCFWVFCSLRSFHSLLFVFVSFLSICSQSINS